MIWSSKYSKEWVRHFALLPTLVENQTKVVWLQFYWKKFLIEGGDPYHPLRINGKWVDAHWITSATDPTKSNF